MSNRFLGTMILVLVFLLGFSQLVYVVYEQERAVLLKFGKLVDGDIQPGLHFKVPLMHDVRRFDARILTVDAPPESILTAEKKALDVDSFIKWRIVNVEKYYTTTGGDELAAHGLLRQRVNEGLRNQFGERSLNEVVSGERDELMADLKAHLNSIVLDGLGVEVIDVRVKKIDFPKAVSSDVYNRMRSEREREAKKHRSEGKEKAEFIRASADRQRTVIEAEAYRDAEKIRGEGDATAAAIYASAFNKNPEFYAFTRSLAAYQETFSNKGDVLLVDPDSEFFRYLKDSRGGTP